MERLTVLYDASCGLCVSARRWLESQPQLVRIELVAASSGEAARRYPDLATAVAAGELLAVADERDVYRGDAALIVCLYALDRYREWSFRLAGPEWRPRARRAFALLSSHRKTLSSLFGLRPEEPCHDRSCDRGEP